MKLGYLTKFSPEEPARAQRLGFDCLELHANSWFGNGVYGNKSERQQILDQLRAGREEFGVSVSCIANYSGGLSLRGRELIDSFKKAIDIASECGAKVVATIAGRDNPQKSIQDNIPAYKKSYSTIAKMAGDAGCKIAFENWPAFGGYPLFGKTMPYCPQAWTLMFDAVPNKSMGLEFDPSHLYWQGIDHMAILRQFKDRVHHVHAKDTEIFYDKRNQVGVFGEGWWTYRAPGLGEIKWAPFIAELYTMGYEGGVCIEHEDSRFDPWRQEKDLTKYEQGLRLGHACLRPLIQ